MGKVYIRKNADYFLSLQLSIVLSKISIYPHSFLMISFSKMICRHSIHRIFHQRITLEYFEHQPMTLESVR